jgi:hypothetical protein
MTHFADLAAFTYLGPCAGDARAVGWLEAEHEFVRGDVPSDAMGRLELLFQHAWQPVYAKGWHDCSLCGFTVKNPPIMREIGGRKELLGVKNLLVPAGDVIYAAPSLIIHYIEDHGYKPPDEFLEALATIDPTQDEYRAECERIWNGA